MLNVDGRGGAMGSWQGTSGRYFNGAAQALRRRGFAGGVQVFLDLWGVLLDSDKMQREHGRTIARYLSGRFGGDEARWQTAHTAAWTEYVEAIESPRWDRAAWSATVDRLDGRFVVSLLERMDVPWRPQDPVAFSRELDLQVMSTIDARFPDARAAVERLHAAGHSVYIATQANEANARGSLTGAGLVDSVQGIFTGTSQDAPKTLRVYWDRILSATALPPETCVLVDDRVDYLAAANAAGFHALLLDREGVYEPETMPRFVRATLRNLAGLPHHVDVLEAERRHTST